MIHSRVHLAAQRLNAVKENRRASAVSQTVIDGGGTDSDRAEGGGTERRELWWNSFVMFVTCFKHAASS